MIVYFILLILVLFTYILSKKILLIAQAYNILEDKHTKLFMALKKREDYLLETYKDDLELIGYYSDIHHNSNLSQRINEELELDSIDDEFDELTNEARNLLKDYNDECDNFDSIKKQYPLLYKLQNYIDYTKY